MNGANVVFRADSSLHIGSGHVIRCLTLAAALTQRGAVCQFICREHSGNINAHIQSLGYVVHVLPIPEARWADNTDGIQALTLNHLSWLGASVDDDATECLHILSGMKTDWLIIDHYAIDAAWHQRLRATVGRIMAIDDLADREHLCDVLLDQNLGREVAEYKAKVPEKCILLAGPKYALLRPEFADLRRSIRVRNLDVGGLKLMVSMGGVDIGNSTVAVLNALSAANLQNICSIDVVMGRDAPWLSEVRRVALGMPCPTTVSAGVSDMGVRMLKADLAIGAAGGTSWERCCLGLPAIIVVLASNQRPGALSLSAIGCALVIEHEEEIFAQLPLLMNQISGGQQIQKMSMAASGIADGQGVDRVIHAMECADAA